MNLKPEGNDVKAMVDKEWEFLNWLAHMPIEEMEAIVREATRKAVAEAHAMGLPTPHADEKGVYDPRCQK